MLDDFAGLDDQLHAIRVVEQVRVLKRVTGYADDVGALTYLYRSCRLTDAKNLSVDSRGALDRIPDSDNPRLQCDLETPSPLARSHQVSSRTDPKARVERHAK